MSNVSIKSLKLEDFEHQPVSGVYFNSQQSLYLVDKTSSVESQVIQQDYYDNFKEIVKNILGTFDDRAKDIILSRYLLDKKVTLQVLATKYDISAERVRQIEEEVLAKIKKEIKKQA